MSWTVPPPLRQTIDHFVLRLLQDCLAEETATYWRRRAETYEAAMPKPADFTGRATAEDLAAQAERLAQIAQACRNAATLARFGDYRDLVAFVFDEKTEPGDAA